VQMVMLYYSLAQLFPAGEELLGGHVGGLEELAK